MEPETERRVKQLKAIVVKVMRGTERLKDVQEAVHSVFVCMQIPMTLLPFLFKAKSVLALAASPIPSAPGGHGAPGLCVV